MYKSTKVRRTTLISTLVWSRLWQGKHHTEVLSVIETNKIVKRELENVTRNISNSVFDMVQFSVIVITIGVKDLVLFSTRNDMSLEEWWFAKSAEILSPLFVKESINFLSIFPPSYSQLLRLYSFFTLFVRHSDSEYSWS